MSDARDIRDDLEPGAPEELIRLAERFEQARPVPSAAFRGDLRRRLLAGRLALPHPRPARLRLLIGGYAGAGSMLLLAGAASAGGLGPLGT